MKKSIAILSMALLAGNAFAADVLEVGTDEAPKYYVIKANRGLPFVTYSAEKLNNGGAETSLYRSDELSDAAVWGVVAGAEEGTINIFNYTTKDDKRKQYMFTFITKDDSEFVGAANSGVATTGGAQDVYVKDNGNGSYGLALQNETGVLDGQLWGLDATGGTSQFLGNWQSIGDGGTQWWFYAVDEANIAGSLESINNIVLKDAMDAMITTYANSMSTYAAAVPWVAAELNAGIEALNKLTVSADYQAQIDAVWNEYVGKANAALNTMFDGKIVALTNVRKYNQGNPCYLGDNESGYIGVKSFVDDENARFILESTVYEKITEATEDSEATTEEIPSYYLYNVATERYFGPDRTPVDTKEEACSVRFLLQTGYNRNNAGAIVGLNILANIDGTNAFNLDNANPPSLSYWMASGADSDGSIWAVTAADDEAIVDFITSSSIEKLSAYVSKVPAMVANVLNAGIDEIKALPNSEDLVEKAQAVVENTITTANSLFTTGMNDMQFAVYYPRGNKYLSYGEKVISDENVETFIPVDNYDEENDLWTIKTVEGGVKIYNAANNIYLGPAVVEESGQHNVTAVTEAEAEVYTIELNNASGYYGVSLVFQELVEGEEGEEPTYRERALNMNLNPYCLHTYAKADGGSIFVLEDPNEEEDSISEITVAPAAKGIYDLAGRKLAAPVKGINIINGVKVLVK